MGRWGHRLFEGDADLDMQCDIQSGIQERLKAKGIIIDDEHMTDLFDNMDKPEYRPAPACISTKELRDHLNAMSDELFQHFRANPDEFYGEYTSVILGAVMMTAGANVADDQRSHLREVAGHTRSSVGYRLPLCDDGFRDPGKAQFLAAVQHYEDGKPRDFRGPSCFRCGKLNDDIAPSSLKKCVSCKCAWYCDRECQKADWKSHKAICGGPRRAGGGFMMLNV